jgi:hypothetical protein
LYCSVDPAAIRCTVPAAGVERIKAAIDGRLPRASRFVTDARAPASVAWRLDAILRTRLQVESVGSLSRPRRHCATSSCAILNRAPVDARRGGLLLRDASLHLSSLDFGL